MNRAQWQQTLKLDRHIYDGKIKNKSKFRVLWETLVPTLGNTPRIPETVNTDFLFVKSLVRPDYNQLWNQITDQVRGDKAVIEILVDSKRGEKIYGIYLLIRLFPFYISILGREPAQSFYCYLKRIQYEKFLRKIAKYRYRTLVVFADMQPIERALVFQARRQGRTTVTLQHGLYVDYGGLDNFNRINYENACSDYFLAWGNETKELIVRHAPTTSVVICGKPFFFPEPEESKGYFSIVFDQKLYAEYNREMLRIGRLLGKRLSLKVNLRLHPYDSVEAYDMDGSDILLNEPIEHSEFVIGHTSTMVFETMRMGIPVYRYKTHIPVNSVKAPIEFTDVESLTVLMEKNKAFDWKAAGAFYIEFVGNESLGEYEKFFKQLAESR